LLTIAVNNLFSVEFIVDYCCKYSIILLD
jgi:hypothetical protein